MVNCSQDPATLVPHNLNIDIIEHQIREGNSMKVVKVVVTTIFLTFLVIGSAQAEGPQIGVADFSNTSGAYWWTGGVGHDLASMVSNELRLTGVPVF